MFLQSFNVFNIAIVLYFCSKASYSLNVKIYTNVISSQFNESSFPVDVNCGPFDINCQERRLQSNSCSFDSEDNNFRYQCSLRQLKWNIFWWTYPNGSLTLSNYEDYQNSFSDLSYRNLENKDLYSEIFNDMKRNSVWNIKAFSAAGNMLTVIPFTTLSFINETLLYLSLKGNNFGHQEIKLNNKTKMRRVPILRFPKMDKLKGLDLSNCSLESINEKSFKNITRLESLFLSNNNIMAIGPNAFIYMGNLRVLDLSEIDSVLSTDTSHAVPTVEAYLSVFEGLDIAEDAFRSLPNLEYLDFSYTKIARSSVKAFAHLGGALEYLSLCSTSIPIIGKGIFANTSLKAIDLSGNAYASYYIGEESFEGVDDSLEFLAFEKSNIKSLEWLRHLRKLKVLKLGGNNINNLNNETFKFLTELQLLDLNSNHIGNWYYRVFERNKNLMVLSLRQNNINLISPEMLRDFSTMAYLAIGCNDFVCDCFLRDFIDVAAINTNSDECIQNIIHGEIQINITGKATFLSKKQFSPDIEKHDIVSVAVNHYRPLLERSHVNILESYNKELEMNRQEEVRISKENSKIQNITAYCKWTNAKSQNSSRFSFQLLDYTKNDYWCFNRSEQLELIKVARCTSKSYDSPIENATKKTKFIVYVSVFGSVVVLVSVILYYNRCHIRYYYYTLKNSSVLKFYMNKKSNRRTDLPRFTYDIFVSYSDNDREWVLQELLPNIEDTEQVTVCLHERDFQVGMTILENIISCMDKSRCVLLIVSKSFLSSQWCLFELNLAQHRLIEIKRENLILILLEDIPRFKRPRILQYLMHLKTYLKWPNSAELKLSLSVIEEKKLFWKRLKNSLVYINFNKKPLDV